MEGTKTSDLQSEKDAITLKTMTLNIATLSITILSITTLSITTLSITTLSITTISITTISVKTKKHNDIQVYNGNCRTQHKGTQNNNRKYKKSTKNKNV